MRYERLHARDVAGAREGILDLIQNNPRSNITIYFHGWNGFGATAVLRSIPQALVTMRDPPPKLCFDKKIYIDCSTWESKRVMQRKITEELKLDQRTRAMFEEQDEEDDFNGVDHVSRDVVWEVSAVIEESLRGSRIIVVFLNGSNNGEVITLSDFGIPEYYCTIVWTFSRRFVTMDEFQYLKDIAKLGESLRRTNLLIYTLNKPTGLSDSQLNALLYEEAASIVARYPFMQDMGLNMVTECWRYGFFLRRSSHSTIGLDWAAHAPNFWVCDGVIQGDRAREISNALESEISYGGDSSLLNEVFARMMQHSETSHLVVEHEEDHKSIKTYAKRPYRWIFVTSKNKIVQDNMQTIVARASSIFLAFDRTIGAPRLPNALFKQCNRLGVLVLSGCAFSFGSPPFLHCLTLRFLGLSNCTHQNNPTQHEEGDSVTKWACLHSLWVLDLRYTDWGEILSDEKTGLMTNLTELSIEGVRCWQYASQLQKRLPCLQRLRIIKPARHQEHAVSMDMDSSFVNKKKLEILDLSGNSNMKKLPAGLAAEASRLEVLVLDGCDELQDVVLHNCLLRSFSFDGYGSASHWMASTGKLPPMSSRPEASSAGGKKDAKTSKISLKGCTRLDKLFLRGLPNLVELDLSGCAIKVLDFGAMVVDVPKLKRLFLLGCECLRAIKWGSVEQQSKLLLQLICIDIRPGTWGMRSPSLGTHQESSRLQVHAVITDARLARSLWTLVDRTNKDGCCFNISITTSSSASSDEVDLKPEATESKETMVGSSDQRSRCVVAAGGLYGDVSTKVADDGLLSSSMMQAFPQDPMEQLDRHIEIGDGSRHVQSEAEVSDPNYANNLAMVRYTQSLHVHDVSTCTNTMPIAYWLSLRRCRVERCPNLLAVFPPNTHEVYGKLETIRSSDLLAARCIWSKGVIELDLPRFKSLQHLHLRRCPSLQFALAMGSPSFFPSLETLHIIHCGGLRHVFVPGDEGHRHRGVQFPKLTTIHLHDVPALREICEDAKMLAPALKTIKIRGCWSLRRLPALKGRKPGRRRPTVEVEKDVWDKLDWDGVDAGHHPSLYKAPVHSRYYKKGCMLRGTVLR
ncbi:hypothetical protein BS78_07G015400 [Paspalum vaginatum]|nr:hypothetical protein BS78_07G015400 [Paspalum vaginatum]KAJ1266900.1 hypothetical protein BS78_07G015400 [Paspalum vaginatum]